MNKIILIGLCIFLFVSFANADLVSINNGGSNNLVIHPGSLIEKFFFGVEGLVSALTTWEFAVVGGLLGISLLFIYLSKKLDDEHDALKKMLYMVSVLFALCSIFISLEIAIGENVAISSLMTVIWGAMMIFFVTYMAYWIIVTLIYFLNLLRSNVR